MLNLLIAIVGERYEQVDIVSKNYMYQERAEAIAQIQTMMTKEEKKALDEQDIEDLGGECNKLLIIAMEDVQEQRPKAKE
jgi:hypothetical protein